MKQLPTDQYEVVTTKPKVNPDMLSAMQVAYRIIYEGFPGVTEYQTIDTALNSLETVKSEYVNPRNALDLLVTAKLVIKCPVLGVYYRPLNSTTEAYLPAIFDVV